MSIISKINLLENNDLGNGHSILVSRKMDTYFNDLLNVPDNLQTGGIRSEYGFGKFYSEYIEHNLLLLFIILCLGIFLVIKYINKNSEYDENITKNDDNTTQEETDTDDTKNPRTKKSKINSNKKDIKRELLELEKQSILDIIDELSNINYEKIQKNNEIIKQAQSQKYDYIENEYLEPAEQTHINNTPQSNIFTNKMAEYASYEPTTQSLDYSLINSNYISDNNKYYNLTKKPDYANEDNPNYIKGIYIESPYEQ